MSFWVWIEIVCRGCAVQGFGLHVSEPRIPRREIAKAMRDRNWDLMDCEWFCPKCKDNRYQILGIEKNV